MTLVTVVSGLSAFHSSTTARSEEAAALVLAKTERATNSAPSMPIQRLRTLHPSWCWLGSSPQPPHQLAWRPIPTPLQGIRIFGVERGRPRLGRAYLRP